MTTKNTCFIIFFLLHLLKIWACAANFREGGGGGRVGWGKGERMSFGQKSRGGTSIFLLKPPQPLPPLRGPCQLDTRSFFLKWAQIKRSRFF